MPFLMAAQLMGAGVMALACDIDSTGKNRCRDDDDCLNGYDCQFSVGTDLGTCVALEACWTSDDCPTWQSCYDYICYDWCLDHSDCGLHSLCFDIDGEFGESICLRFDPCPEDGECEIGAIGAVCNEGIFEDKERICLFGMCLKASHCPADWKCLELEWEEMPVGYCSDGSPGTVCNDNDDCQSHSCFAHYCV